MSLPIPAATWSESRAYHDKEFVAYVDEAIRTWGDPLPGPASEDRH